MWVFLPQGFVSIVRFKGRGRRGSLVVRARERKVLADLFPGRKIEATPASDYPFRVYASAADVGDILAMRLCAIDYPNFKAEVARRGDWDLYHALAAIWRTLWDAYRMHR